MSGWLIRNARVVNEGRVFDADVLVRDGLIERVAPEGLGEARSVKEIDAGGRLLMPGVIDDQVHFREPGLTHKEDIAHGSPADLTLVVHDSKWRHTRNNYVCKGVVSHV